MIYIIILFSLLFSCVVGYALRGFGTRWMIGGAAINFAIYMTGLWLIGGFG